MDEFKSALQPDSDIRARYEKASRIMQGVFTKELTCNDTVFPVWIGDSDCFWYVRHTRATQEYRLVNAKEARNEPAFDHVALAAALSRAAGGAEVDPANLPLEQLEMALSPRIVTFDAFDRRWRYDDTAGTLDEVRALPQKVAPSPCGRYLIARKDHNLWLTDTETGEERPLTTDGAADFSYGAPGSTWGWEMPGGPQLAWAPDSSRVLTIQRDTRAVGRTPISHTVPADGSIRPKVQHVPIALPGDDALETYRLVSIDIKSGAQTEADYHQLISDRNSWTFFDSRMGWWSKDSRRVYFVDIDRYRKDVKVVEMDADSGACRVLFHETSDTHVRLQLLHAPAFLPLPDADELVWPSERSGAMQYYLYDLQTGAVKRQLTLGPGLVRNPVRYIPETRDLFLQTSGWRNEINPYYRDVVRLNLETGACEDVASGDHECVAVSQPRDMLTSFFKPLGLPNGACAVSPTGDFVVVTETRVDHPSVTRLYDRDGAALMTVEEADVSHLPEGWQWPEPVLLKAADGATDIHGIIYRPSDFNGAASYPVILLNFNQPEFATVSKGSFGNGVGAGRYYLTGAALAELGFIVVHIDGRGSPERDKAFYDESYGNMDRANLLEDQMAGLQQLAAKYPFMDMTRVGIASILSGGSGAVQGMLKYPDFFKVGVSTCLHDSRLISTALASDEFEGPDVNRSYPEDLAHQLKGKLFLSHGMLDIDISVAATMRLVDALQRANKDFDLLLLPRMGHGGGEYKYLLRRSWDYFVRHLAGVEPPKEFDIPPLFGANKFLQIRKKASEGATSK